MAADTLNIFSIMSSVAQLAVGGAGTLGVYKYYVEPWQLARSLRTKYGTALWIDCQELNIHLQRIQETLNDDRVFDSLLKIPANDWRNRPDWFTKRGFYTMVTAHKIALVSAWLYAYQQELIFSRTRASSKLLADLYIQTRRIRKAFSDDNSCLWPEYFDAIGSQYVERIGDAYRPLAFSAFCFRCAEDKFFLKFYEQLHMFIHITVEEERNPAKKGRFQRIRSALQDLMKLLEKRRLLAGLQKERIGKDIETRSLEAINLQDQDGE